MGLLTRDSVLFHPPTASYLIEAGATEGREKRGGTEGRAANARESRRQSYRVGWGLGVSPPQPIRGMGERRELPKRESPGRKRILYVFLAHRTRLAV